MAHEYRQRRATIHDVAREAGVSAATVSKVLRGVSSVKADNARRVHDAVTSLGYRMDPLASGLRNEQRRILGAVVPDLESPFFGALVTGLERVAEEAGYAMIVASSRESEAREADLVARMNDWRVAARCCTVRSRTRKRPTTAAETSEEAVWRGRASADARSTHVAADKHPGVPRADVAQLLVGAVANPAQFPLTAKDAHTRKACAQLPIEG